jgi:hypothetical protein
VAEHLLHRLRRLGREGPHPAVALPPSRRLHRLASRHSGEREKLDRSPIAWRDGGLQPGCPMRRCSLARRPPDRERMATSRSGENERREREIENGRERTTREGKRNLLQGSHTILCSEKAHDPCVTLGHS